MLEKNIRNCLWLFTMILVIFLIGCSGEKREYQTANKTMQSYFEAHVNQDHDEMMKYLYKKTVQDSVENGTMKKGQVEKPNNFQEMGERYEMWLYDGFFENQNSNNKKLEFLVYRTRYFDPTTNKEETIHFALAPTENAKTKWKVVNKFGISEPHLIKKVNKSIANEDKDSYLIHQYKN